MADPTPPVDNDDGSSAPRAGGGNPAQRLVDTLVRAYREQIRRTLEVELDDSVTALAFVDHHLASARDEDREPILSLLASTAGAYYGELIRRHLGATWLGDGKDPRKLRLLLEPQFVFFSPVDQAYEAIAGAGIEPGDPRLPSSEPAFDPAFHLRPPRHEDDEDELADDTPETEDASWLDERLSELAPVPEDQFHSLTCRFETLQLMLELLAAKHASEGRSPRRLGVADYVRALG